MFASTTKNSSMSKFTKLTLSKNWNKNCDIKLSFTVRYVGVIYFFIIYSTKALSSAAVFHPPLINPQTLPEEITFIPGDTDYEYNRPFLRCEAIGIPDPQYRWTKNGEELVWQNDSNRIVQNGGALIFHSFVSEDAARYQCFAYNQEGTATSSSVFMRAIELQDFKDMQPSVFNIEEGKPFKLSCNPPEGYPTPVASWQQKEIDKPHARPISIFSPRITTSPDGNLWFSNVTISDNSTKYAYFCVVHNGDLRKFSSPKYINVFSKTDVAPAEQVHTLMMQYASTSNTTAQIGSTVALWCIVGGTPLPVITWTKNEKASFELLNNTRYALQNYGKTFVISNVDLHDEGSYVCTAKNGIDDPISHSMHLTVHITPYFLVKPENKFSIKDKAIHVFECVAKGKPIPEIKWTHNGKLLRKNSRIEVLPNRLVIWNSTEADRGNYGCNASNEIGYVYWETALPLLSTRAKISAETVKVEAVHGDFVTLKFHALGFPDPVCVCYDNQYIPVSDTHSNQYISFQQGLLLWSISDVSEVHSGNFSCQACNKYGCDVATVTLYVKKEWEIVVEPKAQIVHLQETAHFICSVKSYSNFLNVSVRWEKDGYIIPTNRSSPHYHQLDDNTLHITNSTIFDSGHYFCIVRNENDIVEYSSAHLTVTGVPNKPAITLSCRNETAYINFQSRGDNGLPILFYQIKIVARSNLSPELWKIDREHLSPTKTILEVSLEPYGNYTFEVTANNKLGASLPSVVMCSSDPVVPILNPTDVKGLGNSSTNMVISWKSMPPIQHNGPNFMYVVEWKIEGNKLLDWQSKNITDWTSNHFIVQNLPSFTAYLIRVRAFNQVGEAAAPAPVYTGYSGIAETTGNETWILPASISMAIVIVLLAVGLILIRRYYKRALISHSEMNGFYHGSNSKNVKNKAHSNSYDKKRYEVDRKLFSFVEDGILGSGEFGLVCKGALNKDGSTKSVAIKMINPNKIRRQTIAGLLSEIKVLAYIGKHENITELLGANTAEVRLGKVYVILEMCLLGSLEKYLRNLKPADRLDENVGDAGYSNLIGINGLVSVTLDPSLSQDLYRWSLEICNGMAFLATKHVVHADLATRNILLGVDKTAKICDFGLSRRMYNYSSYVKSQQDPLPWKWMAPESLSIHEFNEKTDVWAFGVTLWEMYSLGDSPYQGLHWDPNFAQMLRNGFRLGQPEFNERNMYSLMKRCWNIIPEHRPCFADLVNYFEGSQ